MGSDVDFHYELVGNRDGRHALTPVKFMQMAIFHSSQRFAAAAVSLAFVCSGSVMFAGTFTWNKTVNENWGTAANWNEGLPTFAADDILDFTTLNISGLIEMDLQGNRTAGTLKFADISGADGSWLVKKNTLTLATSSGTPEIAVTNQGVNFGGIVAGTQGFTKTGAGGVYFTNFDTHTGGIVVSGGTLGVYNTTNTADTMLGAVPGSFEAANISLASDTTFANRNIGGFGSDLTLVANRGITLTGGGTTNFDVVAGSMGEARTVTINGAITGSGTINHTGNNNSTLSLKGVISSGVAISNANGALNLEAINTYTGATTVNSGAIVVNGSTASGSAVTVNSSGTLTGHGTVNGTVTVKNGGTLTAGFREVNKITTGNTTFESGSIFAWELGNTPVTTGRGTDYDAVNTSGLSGSGAIFRVVLNSTQDFSEAFWDSNRTWTDIFTNVAGNTSLSIASIFSSVQYYNATNGVLANPSSTQGSFAFSGTNLQWTAVPEPSGLLAGILLGAGLFRRSRLSTCR